MSLRVAELPRLRLGLVRALIELHLAHNLLEIVPQELLVSLRTYWASPRSCCLVPAT